jgi:hypothetical protein
MERTSTTVASTIAWRLRRQRSELVLFSLSPYFRAIGFSLRLGSTLIETRFSHFLLHLSFVAEMKLTLSNQVQY